ncbi:MAG: hypothetical protein ACKVRN_10885 [Pyrinomonadaceae bacterium]
MENKIKRPPSVLIAQSLMISLALVCLVPHVIVIEDFVDRGFIVHGYFPVLVIATVTFFLLLVSFWGLMFRRSYGLWLAVLLLTTISIGLFLQWVSETLSASAEPRLTLISVMAIPSLTALVFYLVHRLVFGKQVRAFFNEQQIPSQTPPPSFDS